MTKDWVKNYAPWVSNVYLNPCPLPEKEGKSSYEVKLEHVKTIKKDYPSEVIGGFFDDDITVFNYLMSNNIPVFLVR